MKDRLQPCIYYICANEDCRKGFKRVNLDKCKNCEKYMPRKSKHKQENIKIKRMKDKDRHDKDRYY